MEEKIKQYKHTLMELAQLGDEITDMANEYDWTEGPHQKDLLTILEIIDATRSYVGF